MAKFMNDDIDEEPRDDDVLTSDGSEPKVKGRRKSFGKLRRELTDEELASPGAQKLLLDELDRLDGCESEADDWKTKFFKKEKEVAVLSGRLSSQTAFDVLSIGTIAIGSALISFFAGNLSTAANNIGAISDSNATAAEQIDAANQAAVSVDLSSLFGIVAGVILIVIGIVAKVVKS